MMIEDKRREIQGKRGISEKDLLIVGILGGWPTGLISMEAIDHKTRNVSFQSHYSCIIVVNLLCIFLIGRRFSKIRIQ